MRAADALGIVGSRIRARVLESLLVVLGVALGVGVIASTLSLYKLVTSFAEGGRELLEITVRMPDSENPRSGPVQRIASGTADERVALLPEDMDAVKSAAPDVAHGYFGGMFSQGKGVAEVTGIIAGDYFDAFGLRAAEGTLFTPADEASGSRVAVLGARKAQLLFPDGGAVGSTVQVFGLDFHVVGVLAATGAASDGNGPPSADLTYVPLRSSIVYEKMRSIPSITFTAATEAALPRAVAEVRAYYDARHGPGAVEVMARTEEIQREQRQNQGVLAVLLVFAGAGLFIASINMLNVLLSRVARRVRSTGISVALGEPRGGVFRSNVLESLALGTAGCLAGILVALAFNALIQLLFNGYSSDPQTLVLSPGIALVAAAVALGINLLFALYPAWRAARMNAADAIRAE